MKTKRLSFKLTAILMALTMLFVSMPLTITASDLGQSTEEVQSSTPSGTDSSVSSVSSEQLALGGESSLSELTEDVTLRDKFTKHYTDADGKRYAVVFSEQVHYLENENWVEIDNSLKYDPATKKYVSGNSGFGTAFADNANASQLVSMTDGEHSLSWSVTFAQESSSSKLTATESTMSVQSSAGILAEQSDNGVKTEENMSDMGKAVSGIRYNSVHLSSVDLRYSVLHGKVEEDIILNSSDGFTSYMLTVNTGGLTAVKNADNSISFNDASGEEIFKLGAPWMKDSLISVSDDIAVELLQKGNTAYIAYTPNAEWLQDESRVYPVLIDPSFTTRKYTSNYEDTYVYEGDSSSTTRPTETTMKVGNISGNTYYAYIKILNIPAINPMWIDLQASFIFYADTTSSPALSIYGVSEEWEADEITYDNQPYSELVRDEVHGTLIGTYSRYSFDITTYVEENLVGYGAPDWNGFKIGYTEELTNNYVQIYSSEKYESMRPCMVISYTYSPEYCIEDGSVYSFKNIASGSYLTVHNGLTDYETNVYQKSVEEDEELTLSQAFRLLYDEQDDCFNIVACCSESNEYVSVLEFFYSSTTNNTTGYVPTNVHLCEISDGGVEYQQWIIESYDGDTQFKIVSRADPNLALTAYGTADGTANGTTATSPGNVFVSYFTGATNQLWSLESGGCTVVPSESNIKTAYDNDETFDLLENRVEYPLFSCPVDTFGDTVTWRSSNTAVATVDQSGRVTTHSAGITLIEASVYDGDGGYDDYYCTLYVKLANGVYYITNVDTGYNIEYETPDDLSENAVLEVYDEAEIPDEDSRHQMFKIKYLGLGQYSIRSMLKSDMGWTNVNNELVITTIGTSDTAIPNSAKWTINSNTNGYAFFNSGKAVTSFEDVCEDLYLGTSSLSNMLQRWDMTEIEVTSAYNGVVIYNSVSSLVAGKQATFTAGVYSAYTDVNGQHPITWSVTNGTGSATIDSSTGVLTAQSTGTVTVRATFILNNNVSLITDKLITIYRPAVILIHGRTDNSFSVWGANTRVYVNPLDPTERGNNHYNSSITAATTEGIIASYTARTTQELYSYEYNDELTIEAVFNGLYTGDDEHPYEEEHPEGGNLAYYLVQQGYTVNVDLFVFNYPNEDAVVHNANKLDAYLTNLASYIRTSGTTQAKLSFFGKSSGITSTSSYCIDIVGHSMGGLVARYYIENIGKDENVRRLITIGTPHWGSGLADASCLTGALHCVCDHDLRFDSCMYGGKYSTSIECTLLAPCCDEAYTFTDELNYSANRSTKYYAIAGLDYNAANLDSNNYCFEIDPDYVTFDDITDNLQREAANKLYKYEVHDGVIYKILIAIKSEGDNVVGFLSQIGCTEDGDDSPDKKIEFEKIFVNIDSDSGNSVLDHFHSKMPHRTVVMEKVFEYLSYMEETDE